MHNTLAGTESLYNYWTTGINTTTYTSSSLFSPYYMAQKTEEPVSNELKINIKKSQIKFNFNL